MKQRLLELIGEYINNEKEKENFIKDIDELIFVWDKNLLDILQNKHKNLFERILNKIIPDFSTNQSYLNSIEIFKSYQQFGDIDINHNYLVEVNKFLLYLKNLVLEKRKNLKINDTTELNKLYDQLQNDVEVIDYELLYKFLKQIDLTKEEYENISNYLKERQSRFNKEVLLSQTLNSSQLEENFAVLLDITRQIFISEIDKLPSIDDKLKKIDELLANDIYGNVVDKTNAIEILKAIIKDEILEEEALVNELDDNEKKEVLDNVNLLYKLIVYLNGKEKEFDENEEIRDTYFDYENHKNKIVYLSNNILKDIESIDDFKTLKDLYGLLIGIKEGRIPVKSHMQKMQIPNRKIKKIRPNSNNSQARINCEILGNNTFGIVLINAKKDTTTDKSTITSINERLKMYNPDTVLDSLDMEKQKEYDREVYDLIMGKLNKKMAK